MLLLNGQCLKVNLIALKYGAQSVYLMMVLVQILQKCDKNGINKAKM